MKILFVASGNKGDVNSLVKNQGISLSETGFSVEYFPIKGKGIFGYLRNIPEIRHRVKKGNFNLVHAHYSFSAMAASLAGRFPLVVSLMGSDAYMNFFWRTVIRFLTRFRWQAVIVKSQKMKEILRLGESHVIPNGVNPNLFKFIDREQARKEINYTGKEIMLLYAANPARKEKNYPLALEAFKLLQDEKTELLTLSGQAADKMPHYINAANVLILPSLWEGSPNIIKEAMACNCPVVATDVGDIAWLFGSEPGYFIAPFDPAGFSEKLKQAIDFSLSKDRTNGRQRIKELQLDSQSVAKRIIAVYEQVILENQK